jgi:hypothetical protein
MIYDSNGPIYSVLTGKSPCGSYGGVELSGSGYYTGENCTSGKIGPYCRGGIVSSGSTDWCCFGPCSTDSDCINGNPCNGGSCCGTGGCTYCYVEYYPQNDPNFTGEYTTDPGNCPGGTFAVHGPTLEPAWKCVKYYGPFYDITDQDLPGGSPLYLERCPLLGPDYLLPVPFTTGKCAGECCDLNTETCNGALGCVPRS